MDGDQIDARWTLRSGRMMWLADSAAARRLTSIQQIVTQVLSGVSALQMNASVTGSMKSPTLAVSSNLDRVVADQVKNVIGV